MVQNSESVKSVFSGVSDSDCATAREKTSEVLRYGATSVRVASREDSENTITVRARTSEKLKQACEHLASVCETVSV